MKNVLDTINHPKATPEKIKQMKDNGAPARTRTADLLITNQL